LSNHFVITMGDVVNAAKWIGNQFMSLSRAYGEQEMAEKKLTDAMKAQGVYTKEAIKTNVEFANSLQYVTKFTDETILSAMKMLTTFGLHDEQLRETTKIIADMASSMGIDLESAARLVGKAFSGETTTLKRFGISIDENIPKSERFSAVLTQLQSRFGGAAAGEVDTFNGKLAMFDKNIGEIKENIGKYLMPTMNFWLDVLKKIGLAIEGLTREDDKFTVAADKNMKSRLNMVQREQVDVIKAMNEIKLHRATDSKELQKIDDIALKHLQEKLNLLDKSIVFLKKEVAEEIKTDKIKENLSKQELANKRKFKIEADDLAVDSKIKSTQLEATKSSWSIAKQQEVLLALRAHVIQGTDAWRKYTDEIAALEQTKQQKIADTINSLSSTFGSFIASTIDWSKTGAENWTKVWATAKDSIIKYITQMTAKIAAMLAIKGVLALLGVGTVGTVGSMIKGVIGFDEGGTVPGAMGSPQLIMAHGGETVLPTHKTSYTTANNPVMITMGSININGSVDKTNIKSIAAQLQKSIKDGTIEGLALAKTMYKKGNERSSEAG